MRRNFLRVRTVSSEIVYYALFYFFQNYKAAHLARSDFGWLHNRSENLDVEKWEVFKVDWDVYLSEKMYRYPHLQIVRSVTVEVRTMLKNRVMTGQN